MISRIQILIIDKKFQTKGGLFIVKNKLNNLYPFPSGVNIDQDLMNEVVDMVEEMTRKNVLNKHPYAITETTRRGQKCFITYVYDESKANHRKQISASTLENLENKIYEAYKQKDVLTFEKVSLEWLKAYKGKVKPQTFSRTMTDYNRFIPHCSFSQKSIKAIDTLEIETYLEKTILDEKLLEQAYKNLKSILNGIFKFALKRKYITENPMETVEVSTTNLVVLPKKTKEAVVFTNKERDLLKTYIKHDRDNYRNTAPYAILLSFQLGLRVGELIALKWTDIEGKKIHIQRQEVIYDVYDEELKKTAGSVHKVVEYTKTKAGERFLPLTPTARKILISVKAWNKENKIDSEYIFADANGRNYNRQRINTCLYNYCVAVDIIKKSSHKIRRSVISNLLDNIANKVSVSEFAGHENLQTTINAYYKDVSDDNDLFNGMCACL